MRPDDLHGTPVDTLGPPDHFDVVREVAYRIDVSALHASAIPGGLSSFTENLEP